MSDFTRTVVLAKTTDLPAPETPLQELWRIFHKDRLAVIGLVVLSFLLIAALAGKGLTEWTVTFDPATVRLPDKFKPPLSSASVDLIPPADRPLFGTYLLGTDELGRDVFARMLQGSFVSLSIGFIAVGISVLIGIVLGGLAGFYGTAHGTDWGGLMAASTLTAIPVVVFFLLVQRRIVFGLTQGAVRG